MPLTLLSPLDAAMSHLPLASRKADGGFEGEMVWNTMILSQYILTQRAIGKTDRQTDRRQDGFALPHNPLGRRLGMHGESDGYVYFTAMAYVALRVLGVAATDPLCADARAWLARQPEGVLGIPHWGKFWLAMCGLYGWDGVNPFPPELFVTPKWLPIHPFRFLQPHALHLPGHRVSVWEALSDFAWRVVPDAAQRTVRSSGPASVW